MSVNADDKPTELRHDRHTCPLSRPRFADNQAAFGRTQSGRGDSEQHRPSPAARASGSSYRAASKYRRCPRTGKFEGQLDPT